MKMFKFKFKLKMNYHVLLRLIRYSKVYLENIKIELVSFIKFEILMIYKPYSLINLYFKINQSILYIKIS
jgi:hypothetical protein